MADVDSDDHIEVKRPSGPAATAADRAEELAESGAQGHDPADQSTAGQSSQQSARSTGNQSSQQPGQPTAPPAGQSPAQSTPPAGQGGDASIGAARESLVRTLVSQARQAEAADDPRQAADHLEAARTAAETLAALSS
jgi:hypothetical protein